MTGIFNFNLLSPLILALFFFLYFKNENIFVDYEEYISIFEQTYLLQLHIFTYRKTLPKRKHERNVASATTSPLTYSNIVVAVRQVKGRKQNSRSQDNGPSLTIDFYLLSCKNGCFEVGNS